MSYLDLSAPTPTASPTLTPRPTVTALEWGLPTKAPVTNFLISNTDTEFSSITADSGNEPSTNSKNDAVSGAVIGIGVGLLVGLVLAVGLFAKLKFHKRVERERTSSDKAGEHEFDIEMNEPEKYDEVLQEHKKVEKKKNHGEVLQKNHQVRKKENHGQADDSLVDQFSSGNILGADLALWCMRRKAALPSIEKLTLSILQKYGMKNMNDCSWAKSSEYGKALHELTKDDITKQVEILWAIQEYCSMLGFPKTKSEGEFLIDELFKCMYEFCLVSPNAFFAWSNDNTSKPVGKTSALVQTLEWFQWLTSEHANDELHEEDASSSFFPTSIFCS